MKVYPHKGHCITVTITEFNWDQAFHYDGKSMKYNEEKESSI